MLYFSQEAIIPNTVEEKDGIGTTKNEEVIGMRIEPVTKESEAGNGADYRLKKEEDEIKNI